MNTFSSMSEGNKAVSFVGYGWLVVRGENLVVIDLTGVDGSWIAKEYTIDQNRKSPYPESFLVPVCRNEKQNTLFVEQFWGQHCTHMMIRKWEEFEEYSSTKSFEKWATEQNEKAFLTPHFKVLGRTLLVEDSGKTYCGFRTEEGRYCFEKDHLKKTQKQIFAENNGLYKVANGQILTIAGENFRLIDLYKENNETESNEIKRNEEKWESYDVFFNDKHFWEFVFPPESKFANLNKDHFPEDYVPKPSSDSFSPMKEDGSDFRLRFNEMFGGNHDYTIRYEPDREWTLPGKYRIVFHLDNSRKLIWKNGDEKDLSFDFEILENPDKHLHEEIAFLESFKKYVADCGFKYTDQDLARFHTSIKCGMFTLLGGAPGSGKSSLAALYSRAILGTTDLEKVREGFLAFDVNPSWMEPDELLGFWNLNDMYSCSATGLVPFLRQATGEKLAMVCVEEMNLARVEHYFSNFIQMMSREPNERRLLGVPRDDRISRKELDDKRNCLCLGENLRFVGTSNFDETTQRYSARFYDRCNYIELQPVEDAEAFPVLIPSFVRGELSNGIPYEEFKSWICTDFESRSVSQQVQKKYKALKERLKPLGLLPSRRVDFAIHEYILNRPNWGLPQKDGEVQDSQMVALDEAVAQRILPRYSQNYLRNESMHCDTLQTFFNESFPLSAQFFKTKRTSDELPIPAT